jgi:hypothetical protein
MLALLAPVPAEILADGLELKNPEGLVAFGTGALTEENSGAWSFEFFSKPEINDSRGVLPVLIYGSSTDVVGPHPLFHPGHVTAVAVYEGIRAGVAGKHPRPDFRPKSALIGDWNYPLFWEVSKLKALPKQDHIPLKKLNLAGIGKLKAHSGTPPRGPQLIVVPDQFTGLL